METEADTCHTLITPKLQAAGWESEPHSIAEQRRIVAELDALKCLQAETAAELAALLPANLDRAFKGEL